MSTQNVDLWVSAGGSDTPFYRFYTDSDGSQELQELILDTSKSYTFRRLNKATSHPFYISETGINQTSSDALLITGHGSPSQGITGNQSLKIEFDDSAGDIEELLYYCTSHSSMQGNIQLMEVSPSDPIIRGNSLYTIVDGPSWTEAEENSVKLGGNLVAIGSEQENEYLVSKFDKNYLVSQKPYGINNVNNAYVAWTGLHFDFDSSSFINSNGETQIFFNWASSDDGRSRPLDSSDPEYLSESVGVTLYFSTDNPFLNDGEWEDSPKGPTNLRSGIAEIPFIRRGDSAYVIVEGPTWEEAEANAVALGGHLVTINDAEENDWLHFQFDIRYTGENSYYYTGFTNKRSGGAYEWISGEDVSYTNWLPGEPNNANGLAVEEYAILGWSGWANLETQWNDVSNRTEFTPSGSGRIPDSKLLGIVEISLAPNNTPIGSPTLIGGFNVGEVIRLDSSAINDADNFEGWTPTYEYSWEVSDDNGTTWTELTSSDATDGDDSYTLTSEEVGKQLRGVVSYLDGYGTNEAIASGGELVTPVVRGNSLYTIVDGPSWKEAQQHSASYGGHLAVISSAAENNIVLSLAQQVGNEVHIGYTDEVNEGLWVWVKDEGTTFENWGPQDPNNSWNGAGEDFAILRPYGGTYGSGGNFDSFEEGSWNDISNSNTVWDAGNRVGVAEIPFIRRGDSAYVIVEGPTWEEAEANAQKLGGHLVTINDADENQWLVKAFKDNNSTHTPGGEDIFHIGLHRESATSPWKWSSGEDANFINFGPKEPYNGKLVAAMNTFEEGQYSGNWWGAVSGSWVDGYGEPSRDGNTVGIFGIAEISLAPNNSPKGTPALNGNYQVGQTISIDASEIEDADNFEGWTPTYEYSWEVSGDNGTTWTALTSSDATDGDDSFTLTSDEVGKQLRGVVSYLDGYGTNEVVESDASAVTSNPVIRGNSLYAIVDGPSWAEAEENSNKLGGSLVSINNQAENEFVVDTAKGIDEHTVWIGLKYNAQSSEWEWQSGDSLVYLNWDEDDGQPELIHSIEEYYVGLLSGINSHPEHERYGKNAGKWHDYPVGWWTQATEGIAEVPFIRRGDSAYVIVEGPTWEEAEANANALGGHLVTINDAEENDWLYDNGFRGWIGFTDREQEGDWKWTSKEPVTYINWLSDSPSNTYGTEHYANNGSRGWGDSNNDGYGNFGPGMKYGTAEIKLAPNNTPTGTPTLTGDFKVGQTISIDASDIKDADNFEGWTPTYEYSWEVSNDNGTTWTELTSSDATDGHDSFTITSDEVGKQLRGVVSYLDGYGTNEVVESDASRVTPVIRGNSLYTIVDGHEWIDAQENSEKVGGDLVTINSEEENIWLHSAYEIHPKPDSIANPLTEPTWLYTGFTDKNTEGKWEWISGEPVSYTNWWDNSWSSTVLPPPAPNPNENYMHLGFIPPNKWNDTSNNGTVQNRGGIAEIPFIRRGDSAYVIVEGPTWEEAEANAVALGGHLVTINDADENSFLIQSFGDSDATLDNQHKDIFFIGLEESFSTWEWTSGQDFTYENWGDGQPAHDGDKVEINLHKDNFFESGWLLQDGSWNDFPSNNAAGHASRRGIAEIPLALNNTPTGTPILNGYFKVGETINIDAAAVEDADNFEGWTPTYEYSWEVSNDNGTTWTALTSTDATDGDDSYTITSEEIGKQLRGVVSYLDGYGTIETLQTAELSHSGPIDDNGDGLADGTTTIQVINADGDAVELTKPNGKTYSINSLSPWTAIKAIPSDTGFDVLLQSGWSDQLYKYLSADHTGAVGSISPRWLKSDQMFTAGYETVFSHDFNGDGLNGFFDDDSDGFVDDTGSYLFHTDDTPVSLTKAGRALSSRHHWYGTPIKAVSTDDGFAVLFSHPNKENVFQVVSTDDGGEWQTTSKWKLADALRSYEELLDYDINGDTERGFVDLDGNGFTDGFTQYQFHSDSGPIAFTKAGRALSARHRWIGTPIKAVSTDDGFAVLFSHPSKENVFQVASTDQSGAWLNTSRWKKADWLWMNGYESLFNQDINGGGIGFRDEDGDGFLDAVTKLNFLTDDGNIVPFRNAAGWQFKPTINWSAVQSVETDTGFDVLIQHQFRHDTYKVVETDTDGRSINDKGTGWKSGNWMMRQGYEQHFNRNIDTDPIIGFSDQNADGFLDGASALKMIHADGLVDFKNTNGVTYGVYSGRRDWDARKAIPTTDGFQVLLDKENIHGDLFYQVVTTGTDGVTTGNTPWQTADWMLERNYGTVFGTELFI